MSDSMELPEGKTCGDCAYFSKCSWLVGARPGFTHCDFFPIRFAPAAKIDDAIGEKP